MPIHDWTKVRAGTFHNFHVLWTGAITNSLNSGVLPEGYFAMAEQIVGRPEGDVVALERSNGKPRGRAGNGAVAVAPPRPKSRFVLPMQEVRYAEKANRVAIRHALGDVVAVIEIVSPGNKSNQNAIRTFREKSSDLIRQGVNLLIVDLFPPSPRDPQGIHKSIWDEFTDEPFELPADKPLTLVAYQASPEITAYVEPVAVGDALPDMPLFLDGDFYVNLPLEATYAATWNVLPKELKALLA
ncbi:MAG: DUF4058 family protein [Gemmataceae bacterium]